MVDHDLLVIEVVRDDARNVNGQGADPPAVQQVVQAMAETRHHQDHFHFAAFVVKVVAHVEIRCCGGEGRTQRVQCCALFAAEADAHEEIAGFEIVKLGAVRNVAAMIGKKGGDCGDDSAGGFAFYGQGEIGHCGLFGWGFCGYSHLYWRLNGERCTAKAENTSGLSVAEEKVSDRRDACKDKKPAHPCSGWAGWMMSRGQDRWGSVSRPSYRRSRHHQCQA